MAALRPCFNDAVDLRQLLHQVLLVVQPSGSVADEHIAATCLGSINGIIDHRCRIRTLGVLDDIHAGTLRPDFQLVDGSCTECIRSGNQNLLALGFQLMAQLADGGSLSGTVDADDNHNGGLGGILQRLILAQHLGDDLLNHAHNQAWIGHATLFHPFPQRLADLHGGLRSEVAHDHGLFQLIEQVVVDLGERVDHLLHPSNHGILGFPQTVPNLGEKALFLELLRLLFRNLLRFPGDVLRFFRLLCFLRL